MGASTSTYTIPQYDPFLYGASGELVGAVATRSQTMRNVGVSAVNVMAGPPQLHHVGLIDSIDQVRLPMSFGVAEATPSLGRTVLSPSKIGNSNSKELVHTLAKKVLQVPTFLGMDLMAPGFQPTGIFHMAMGVLEGTKTMPSLHMAQPIVEVAVSVDSHELIALRARQADKVVIAFAERE